MINQQQSTAQSCEGYIKQGKKMMNPQTYLTSFAAREFVESIFLSKSFINAVNVNSYAQCSVSQQR